jgi:hypothetical protein
MGDIWPPPTVPWPLPSFPHDAPPRPEGPNRTLRLRVTFATDGTPTVRGTVRIPDRAGWTTLVAQPSGAQASCADANGNGDPGITALTFFARDTATGEQLTIGLAPFATEDIDRAGRYDIILRVGDLERRLRVAVRPRERRRRARRG